MIVLCPHCKVKVMIDDAKVKPEGIKVRCARCKNIFAVKKKVTPPLQAAPKKGSVLIAHESDVFRKSIVDVVSRDGYEIIEAPDGAVALQIIEDKLPSVAVLDVMLPKMFGFEITDLVKKNEKLKSVKIILIGDVYDKTRLRREPESYYGADGYIEKPFVLRDISQMLKKVLGAGQAPAPAPVRKKPVIETPPGRVSTITTPTAPAPMEGLSEEERAEHEKAKRLARLIVSDIALYNPQLVDEGIKKGTFFSILDKDIKQAHKLYNERVPEQVRNKTDYLKQAFEEFISNRKKHLQ
jgi:predicted Zn finger-like uncharacterized protein